ncbi:type II toxin-antitoxin system VapC family toxin [Methylobacterium sp. BTF04]|uniref:type II toxin-antitoxin system VapC family toxin n=1 Tax=Methylobacterium sp. BTF04 TaxID=2708300 RepID=UPI0013D01AA2|nr:type II toxin-antitoxin system VapC family toxin [Methylobacterium sp. BTF04]NEU14054.1 type II toxin-antitoxin system VapC family toxin [Methylobacterium sp. BTF04]
MTLFVDASALIAIIAGEADADALSDILESDPDRLCSALSLWETVAGLVRSHALTVAAARAQVELFCEAGDLRLVSIGEAEFALAVEAYGRFGKGRHPASLNMGDCHAYACARAHGAGLLFKGDDFSKTDIAQAGRGP